MSEKMKHTRLIIADDDAETAKIVEEAHKREGHQVRLCPDGEVAMHLVRSWNPHLVLLDINMPKISGLECLKSIREFSKSDYISVMLVTANSGLDQIIQGLDMGADDYIVKPYRVDELRARVRAGLRVKALHDALRLSNRRLEEAATYDDLSGLRNMRFASRRLNDEVEVSKRQKTHLSCIMLDMDHFKLVNDKHDHLFGSFVLCEVGAIIKAMIRPTDIAARYGGDEFFIIMPGTPLKEAAELAEQFRRSIEAHLFKSGVHSAHATASFGVSGTQNIHEFQILDGRELIRSADNALYVAKNSGRNRIDTQAFAQTTLK